MTKSEYLNGARPVLGTIGACGLMLLACSWFVLRPGDLGGSRDVGAPTPVHLAVITGERAASSARQRAPAPGHRTPVQERARTHAAGAARGTAANASIASRSGRKRDSVAAATQSPSAASAASSPAGTPDAPATQEAPPPALPTATPTLPAPLGDVPEVTLPPVSVPQVQLPTESLRVVPTVATQLGLP